MRKLTITFEEKDDGSFDSNVSHDAFSLIELIGLLQIFINRLYGQSFKKKQEET